MNFFMNLNLIGMVFLSGVLSVVYYFVWYNNGEDIKTQIEDVKSKIVSTESSIKKKEKELEEAIAFDDSVKKLGKEIEIFLSYLPEKLTTLNLFEDITKVSRESRVKIRNMTNSQRQGGKSDLYDAIAIRISLEGEYSQLLTFLSKLTALDKFITVKDVRINPINQRDSKNQSRRIKADMTLLGYRYSGSVVQDDEKKKI